MSVGPEQNKDYKIDFDRIKELISKYEVIKKSGEIRKYNEETTKKDFILPLFEALGWNVSNRANKDSSVSAEETISKKRVDYGFRINGIPKFYLEAKPLKEEDIQNNKKYVTQAIDYAWMKSCSWAILTNFETIAVYNADWKSPYYNGNQFFILHPDDFLTDNRFRLLSKDSFDRNELDKEATKYGKKPLKNKIDKQLLQDMINFREILSKNILKNNQDKQLTQDDIDEAVQRILDRLIFIRNTEDRGLEENRLLSNVRQWSSRGKGELIKEISKIYSYFDDQYNSKLFSKHLCDDLYIDNEVLQEVIEGLNQAKDNSYRYDFSIIESDVLGNIYEQYLGNILKTTPKRAKLESSRTHRKEQGIYYTPSYIVDYIVKNTVGEYIKTHTPDEIRNVKILDPACGSGSFLIRAYKELENYWIKNSDFAQLTLDSEEFYSKKVEILKNNIFGVDLDPKAVEIAQLNLLLQISERKQRLPILQNNIKVGNSLIDDPNVSDKAFKWEEEFPEIMSKGGFDIVIGNPPYERTLNFEAEKDFYSSQYLSAFGSYDIYILFIEKSVKILQLDGILGFIVSNKFVVSDYGKKIREFLISNGEIYKVVDLADAKRVFPEALISPIILFFRKTDKERDKNIKRLIVNKNSTIIDDNLLEYIPRQKFVNSNGTFNIRYNKAEESIQEKIRAMSTFGNIFGSNIRTGVMGFEYWKMKPFLHNGKKNEHDIRIATNSYIDRYTFLWGKKVNIFNDEFTEPYANINDLPLSCSTKTLFTTKNKIIIRGVAKKLTAVLDNEGIGLLVAVHSLVLNGKYDGNFIVGLLNSKFLNWVHKTRFYLGRIPEGSLKYPISFLKELPFPTSYDDDVVKHISAKVEEIVKTKNEARKLQGYNNDKVNDLLGAISKFESELDSLVYKFYGLSREEIKIIEEQQ
ncbi:MAG: N-6 DNA methylase [Nitrososphaeria archaeon]